MTEVNNPIGNIYVSYRAIATVAYQSALLSYGVVGLTPKNFAEGLTQVLVKDPTLGVEIRFGDNAIQIDLFIMVEYGTRIKSVAESVKDNVSYQVEKVFGLPVKQVTVHVRSLRVSNSD